MRYGQAEVAEFMSKSDRSGFTSCRTEETFQQVSTETYSVFLLQALLLFIKAELACLSPHSFCELRLECKS